MTGPAPQKIHYGIPEYRPACGAWTNRTRPLIKTTDKAQVTCLPCRRTQKYTTSQHGSQ